MKTFKEFTSEEVSEKEINEAMDAMKVFNFYQSAFNTIIKTAEYEIDPKKKLDKINRRILTDYAGDPKKLKEIYKQLIDMSNNLSDDMDKLGSIIG